MRLISILLNQISCNCPTFLSIQIFKSSRLLHFRREALERLLCLDIYKGSNMISWNLLFVLILGGGRPLILSNIILNNIHHTRLIMLELLDTLQIPIPFWGLRHGPILNSKPCDVFGVAFCNIHRSLFKIFNYFLLMMKFLNL